MHCRALAGHKALALAWSHVWEVKNLMIPFPVWRCTKRVWQPNYLPRRQQSINGYHFSWNEAENCARYASSCADMGPLLRPLHAGLWENPWRVLTLFPKYFLGYGRFRSPPTANHGQPPPFDSTQSVGITKKGCCIIYYLCSMNSVCHYYERGRSN